MHHLNMEQLTKSLASLFNLYEANRKFIPTSENEPEFCSFYVLLHLGSDSQLLVYSLFFYLCTGSTVWASKSLVIYLYLQGESLSLWFRHVPAPILKSKEMLFSRKVLRLVTGNGVLMFCSRLPWLASFSEYYCKHLTVI